MKDESDYQLDRELTREQEELNTLKSRVSELHPGKSIRFSFIQQHTGRFSVKTMCRTLQVSRSGYYAWLNRGSSARELVN